MKVNQMITENILGQKVKTGRAVTRKKSLVEHSHTLDVLRLQRAGFFAEPPGSPWIYRWPAGKGRDAREAQIDISLEGDSDSPPALHLSYVATEQRGKMFFYGYMVRLEFTPCHFGGGRWWFRCPLWRHGGFYRAAKLYLPEGGNTFGCRGCYHLTYASCQASHRPSRLEKACERLLWKMGRL